MYLALRFALCLILGHDVYTSDAYTSFVQDTVEIHACPRCRRSKPKGPRKRPTPPGRSQ